MVALYVASLEKGGGKTTISSGLGRHLLSAGKRIGFFKPVISANTKPPKEHTDSDAVFIKHLFALEESPDLLCPVFSDEGNLRQGIKEAYAKVSQDKDVVIVEGVSDQSQASRSIVETLDARVIIVAGYSKELPKAIDSYRNLGRHLLGVVLNKVPASRLARARGEISTQLAQAGVNILGVLPENRFLLTLTIGELTEHIQGEILSGAEKAAELVENLMLGAMGVDPGPAYYSRKANKAAVVRSERADMQLAVLETSTRCLVLTGTTAPNPIVLYRAKEKKVPIILTRDDIPTVVTNIESALGSTRFNQDNKLAKLTEIMEQHFDFPALYKGLGLDS
ncbi:MAG: phosphotransacetylase family protein [Chloroflexi bacterium]|nr:phosphotransacetylase family protein [Chloroflexota bacterium]